MASRHVNLPQHYRHGLRGAIRHNAPAFAFSIMITSTFGSIASEEGSPSVGSVYGFMAGGVLGFLVILAVASAGFRRTRMEAERPVVIVVGSALSLGSTAVGLGAATLVGVLLDGFLAWILAPFAASMAFMLVLGLEYGIAEALDETS